MRLCLDPTIEVGPSNGELIAELPAARGPEVRPRAARRTTGRIRRRCQVGGAP